MNATNTRHSPATTEWFAAWFDSLHYHRLYANRDEREADNLVDRLVAALAPPDGAAALDLGCGQGRHARRLASHGLRVTGVDLSGASIRAASAHATDALRFRRGDMRQPFGSASFDYVFNLFTSFGYFEDPADDVTVVHNIADALKPGGVLVLDYLNVAYAASHLKATDVVERGGTTYCISRWADRRHLFKRIVVDDSGSATLLEYVERVARVGIEDFRFMFSLCGLTVERTYGDYELSPFDAATSPRLILVARKTRAALPPRQVLANAADRLG